MTARGLGLLSRQSADSRRNTLSTVTDGAWFSIPARGLSAAVDFAVRSHRHAAVFLTLFSLVAFLPGFFRIPPVDRDEARFAQATKQMMETHEYVDIRFQDEVRYKKPVGELFVKRQSQFQL